MKVLQFTIPVALDKSVIIDEVDLPHHYPHLHRHKEIQITWIQRGAGTLIAGNNMHDYAPGEIYLLGANLPHVFKSAPEYFNTESSTGIKAFTIFFNTDGALSSLFNLPELKTFKTFLHQHEKGFKVPASKFEEVAERMNNIKSSNGSTQIIYFLELLNSICCMNARLDPLSSYGDYPSISENEGIRIGNIYNFIMQNYGAAITLEDVAKAAFMTPESFCRYFKKHTGHTFIGFLNQVRINEACKKLTTHKFESISTIAYMCGFKSITNFNRVFKTLTGNSPREYLDNYFNNVTRLTRIAG
jgi:AraC-like DNA-binding protein